MARLDLSVVDDFMYENFENIKVTKRGEHWEARCVLCGDSKKNPRKRRFNLDYNDGYPIWQCWNCGRSGNFLQLYCRLRGVSFDKAKKELFNYDSDRLKDQLTSKKEERKEEKIEYEDFSWIKDDCISPGEISDSITQSLARDIVEVFVRERKIPEQFGVMIAYKGDYRARIIIPVYEGDRMIYFQARRIPNSGLIPKYKNPPVDRKLIVLNKEKFDRDKNIVVTEGLIDAFMLGNQGTACLGASFSDEFIGEILKYTDKKVIIAFDNPFLDDRARVEILKFMKGEKKSKYAKRVLYFLPRADHIYSCKDINNIRVNCNVENMYDYVVNNSKGLEQTYYKLKFSRRDIVK